ncbi:MULTISPECIES: hypothetical protein [unclassified Prochlorococcus]|uniref:hypothetical protein n=1 Tax=unclassified Prochlorococcus TaxID=2627481 RepID=UPI000533773A|nr:MULTISPECIES: hypothetical protein [unclassified Prochlorococcus]KGG15037.1 hypothetical protein EV06_0899 [Prochlorococcus sp. MIT 0602]KGG17308.1 hypothetical protein EV07_0746 [Prochlorococcus sp. MIT 0603]
MKYLDFIRPSNAFYLLGILSTASLISIAFSLRSLAPIAEWMEIQKDCIDRTVAFEGLPDKVWSCNGGGR